MPDHVIQDISKPFKYIFYVEKLSYKMCTKFFEIFWNRVKLKCIKRFYLGHLKTIKRYVFREKTVGGMIFVNLT